MHRLTLDDKFKLCRSIAEECIQESELRNLLDKKPNIVAYDGFEPSGRMHIAQVGRITRLLTCPVVLLSSMRHKPSVANMFCVHRGC